MQTRLLIGFALGLGVGALYHYKHKTTPVGQDSLYQAVAQARGKVREAGDPDSDLHASIDRAASNVKDATATVTEKVQQQVGHGTEKAQARVEQATDAAAGKAHEAADRVDT